VAQGITRSGIENGLDGAPSWRRSPQTHTSFPEPCSLTKPDARAGDRCLHGPLYLDRTEVAGEKAWGAETDLFVAVASTVVDDHDTITQESKICGEEVIGQTPDREELVEALTGDGRDWSTAWGEYPASLGPFSGLEHRAEEITQLRAGVTPDADLGFGA
jgi:hypothetical protein